MHTIKPMQILDGWCDAATHLPSAHWNKRPSDTDIDLLVIHNISLPPGEFGGCFVQQFFTGCLPRDTHPYFREIADMRVSAHCLIERGGEITQFVNFNGRAWHAGESCFQGRENCNDFSIGVELEGTDSIPYTDEQYSALTGLTRALMLAYPSITPSRITGHSDIAPHRKTDPGEAFDWPRYHALLSAR